MQDVDETYHIANVQNEDCATLLESTDRLEIVNTNDKTNRGSEWFITHIKKDEYWIQNAKTQSFACYDNRPESGGQVLGKWTKQDVKPAGSVWRIRPTPGPDISYTISPLENADIFWRSFGDEGTPLEMSLPWTARHCQWVFKPVLADTKSSPIIRFGSPDGHMYITQRLLENLPSEKEDAFDLAFEIANTIREITKLPGLEANMDAVERKIMSTATQLVISYNLLTESKSNRSEGDVWVNQFRNVLKSEFCNLYRIRGGSGQVLDAEDEKRRIAEIFEHVNEARLQFELGIDIKTFKNTYEIKEHLRTFIFDRLKPSRKANHKYDLEGDEGKLIRRSVCTPGTRVDLLDAIISWVKDTSPISPDVYWLFGSAGSGKSTIAYTIARRFEFNGDPDSTVILGGNFFCSRQFEETKQSKHIIRTIAYQLSLVCKPFADALRECGTFEAIDHDVEAQIQGLLVKPWQESERNRVSDPSLPCRYLVVIDALDEIEDGRGSKFLGHLFAALNKSQLNGLKFFATSRPDPGLVDQVDSFEPERHHRYRLEDVDRTAVSGDIRKYLTAELPHFANRAEMETLVTSADGLFIYAATVARHMEGRGRFEQEAILKQRLFIDGSRLDGLYLQILTEAFSNVGQEFYELRLRIIHTLLCTPERTSATVAAELVCSPSVRDLYIESATDIVNKLHAVLYTENDRVLSYHKSFSDYLFSKDRSNKFWCDQVVLHPRLTESCFRLMNLGLKFNIANIASSFVLDRDNHSLSANVQRNISTSLGYSCRNWAHHLCAVGSTESQILLPLLSEFLQLRALLWIETMNLLGIGSRCDLMLRMASGVARTFDLVLARNLTEAANFAVYFSGSPAAMSTPHLYISALATWPSKFDPCHRWKASFVGLPACTDATGGGSLALLTLTVESHVTAVGFSSDGMHIVSGSSDGFVRVWDASSGKQLKVLKGHNGWVKSVAFSHDGTRIVSGSDDNSVRVWDAGTGKQLKVLQRGRSWFNSIKDPSYITRVVFGSNDHSLRVLDGDVSADREIETVEGHNSLVNSVAFSHDGTRITSCSEDNSLRVWDAGTGKQLKVLNSHDSPGHPVAFSHDGMRIVSSSYYNSMRVWDAGTGKQLTMLKDHNSTICSVAFSHDGTRIMSSFGDNSVWVWDAETGKQLKVLKGHTSSFHLFAFSHDGTRIVSGSLGGSVRVWDVVTGKQLKVLKGHNAGVKSVAFSHDGTRIVSGSYDNSVRVWDAGTGKQLKVLKGHNSAIYSVAFSHDGTRVVSGSYDNSVRVWDAGTGKQLKVLKGHNRSVKSVAFSHDGTRIVSGSEDNSVRVWDLSIRPLYLQQHHICAQGERKDTGWLLSSSGEDYLMYVPLAVRLPDAWNTITISRTADSSVDFTGAKLGTQWHECYRP